MTHWLLSERNAVYFCARGSCPLECNFRLMIINSKPILRYEREREIYIYINIHTHIYIYKYHSDILRVSWNVWLQRFGVTFIVLCKTDPSKTFTQRCLTFAAYIRIWNNGYIWLNVTTVQLWYLSQKCYLGCWLSCGMFRKQPAATTIPRFREATQQWRVQRSKTWLLQTEKSPFAHEILKVNYS